MPDGLNKLEVVWSTKIEMFEKAFNLYYPELFSFCNKKVDSEPVTKDIIQESFIALWKNLDNLTEEKEILPYLYGVVRKQVLMLYRRSEVHLKYAVDAVNQATLSDNSETLYLKKELEGIISAEISNMPARMQQIYLLRRDDKKTAKQIAEELGISEQTVKNQLQKAYSRLKIRLQAYNSPLIMVGFIMSNVPLLVHH